MDQRMTVAPEHRGPCGRDEANSHELLVGAVVTDDASAAGP
jgi:hypothetical protein